MSQLLILNNPVCNINCIGDTVVITNGVTQEQETFTTMPPSKVEHTTQTLVTTENTVFIAPLIGREKKSLLECFTMILKKKKTVVFDSGLQVSIIDRFWREKCIPNHPVRSLQELLDLGDSLDAFAANGQPLPYDGCVENLHLPENDNPNLVIQVPFLVGQTPSLTLL